MFRTLFSYLGLFFTFLLFLSLWTTILSLHCHFDKWNSSNSNTSCVLRFAKVHLNFIWSLNWMQSCVCPNYDESLIHNYLIFGFEWLVTFDEDPFDEDPLVQFHLMKLHLMKLYLMRFHWCNSIWWSYIWWRSIDEVTFDAIPFDEVTFDCGLFLTLTKMSKFRIFLKMT